MRSKPCGSSSAPFLLEHRQKIGRKYCHMRLALVGRALVARLVHVGAGASAAFGGEVIGDNHAFEVTIAIRRSSQ